MTATGPAVDGAGAPIGMAVNISAALADYSNSSTPEAPYITGETLHIDGGQTAGH